ncbi:MAG: AAA family ATPase [Alphaproteobacteria bacterium]|nr:AAA family ATPase [Alphaproteobacteria bacterium]
MNKKMFFATNLAISLLFMTSAFANPTKNRLETSDKTDSSKPWVSEKIYDKVKPLAPGIALVGGYVALNYMLSNEKRPFSIMNTANNLFGMMGGQYLASQLFVDPIKQAGNHMASEFFPNLLCSQDEIQVLSMKKDMKQWFAEGRISENTYTKFSEYLPEKNKSVYGSDVALLRGSYIHKLAKDAKIFEWKELKPKLDVFLETFNDKVKQQISDMIREIIVASLLPNSQKTVICFHGDPGTGKTYLANKIAELLGVSMTIFDASGDLSALPSKYGNHVNNSEDLLLDLFGHEENNFKNNILFLDEFDKGLNAINNKHTLTNFLLQFLEKQKNNIDAPSISGLHIDISKTIVILACNELPTDNAIRSRMRVIEFGEVSKETQTTIAHNYFDELCKENKIYIEPDQETLQQIIDQNDEPGVRIMKDIIYKYFSHIVIQELLEEEKETFDVEGSYSQYKAEPELNGENITINNIASTGERYILQNHTF